MSHVCWPLMLDGHTGIVSFHGSLYLCPSLGTAQITLLLPKFVHLKSVWVPCQVEKEEVRIRRTVGLKKDEYQLNRKKTRYY